MWHFIMHVLGLDNASGGWYLFWSGFFGDVTILGLIGTTVWKHNCHVDRCWRLGIHQVEVNGRKHVVCRRHNPRPKLLHHPRFGLRHEYNGPGSKGYDKR